ncbi:MAG: hypothetical protein V4730_01070 [Pseudomonadota bacterium]
MRKSGVEKRPWLMALLLTAALSPSLALAMPSYARSYKAEFGYMPSCNACHSDGGGSSVNGYGKAFKAAGKNAAAFGKIGSQDSDADGFSNAAEAAAKANPGNKASTPAKPGDWLDMASLIPREVRARFPKVLTWLPKDALLTPSDIAAAKALGATLKVSDENTIYIPLENQRPAGTALIFPASFQGKTFFLLMATDRQLKISSVSVLHADAVPAAKASKVYASFVGQNVQTLPVANASTLDGAIAVAVKQASALLYVRLKGA